MKPKLKKLTVMGLLILAFQIFYSHFPLPFVKTHRVEIRNMKFVPAEILVSKGDSVIFINHDLVIHNVTDSNKTWASPTIAPKKSWTYIVNEDLSYFCSFHPMMKGRIELKE